MIASLLQVAQEIDKALKSNISPVAKIFVIFCVWFVGALIIMALAVAGAYTSGWVTFIAVFSFMAWFVVCIIMGGMAVKDEF